jgi:hypothetical protein
MPHPSYAEVWVEFLSAAAGGRQSAVFLNEGHYRPHLRVAGGEYLGVVFVDGPDEPIQPGGSTFATVCFVYEPAVNYDALAEGALFEVLEGKSLVGTGRVTRR